MIKNVTLRMIIQIILIILLGWMVFFIAIYTDFWMLIFWIVLFEIILFYSLIRTVNRHRRHLNQFITSISQDDFQNTYTLSVVDNYERELFASFEIINEKLKELRERKEADHFFLQVIIKNINIPILVYDQDEKVTLLNESAVRMLNIPVINTLSALDKLNPDFSSIVRNLGNDKQVVESILFNNKLNKLAIQASEVKTGNTYQKIVSFQDISRELEAQEVEAYQKLIRVLTHEIMNSVIPISTLTQVLKGMLKDHKIEELSSEQIKDLVQGVNTIDSRSEGLVKFVKSYKNITRNPVLEFKNEDLNQLASEVYHLMKPSFEKAGVVLEYQCPEDQIYLECDKNQVSQVIINLLKNALEALTETPNGKVDLIISNHSKLPAVIIQDNGPGIPEEEMENIFIPFFTTKKTGTGVGLSIARKIMKLHNGTIEASSNPGNTQFILQF